MKKRLFALMMACVLILSLGVLFTACEENQPGTTDPGTTDPGTTDPGTNIVIDETIVPGTSSTPSMDIITDPNDSGAQAGEENNYLH